jgi:hypothetical protein
MPLNFPSSALNKWGGSPDPRRALARLVEFSGRSESSTKGGAFNTPAQFACLAVLYTFPCWFLRGQRSRGRYRSGIRVNSRRPTSDRQEHGGPHECVALYGVVSKRLSVCSADAPPRADLFWPRRNLHSARVISAQYCCIGNDRGSRRSVATGCTPIAVQGVYNVQSNLYGQIGNRGSLNEMMTQPEESSNTEVDRCNSKS